MGRSRNISLFLGFFIVSLVLSTKTAIAANRYWVGTSDGANTNDTANWSSSSGNACSVSGGASVPGSSDIAIFNSDCTNGAAINDTFDVSGIDINSGYTGTITQNSGIIITVGSGDWVQDDGVFSGGDSAIDINDIFTINSGANFTSTSATLTVKDDFTINSGATFAHASGIIDFDNSASSVLSCGDKSFNAILFNKTSSSYTTTVGSDCTLPVGGTNPSTTGDVINNGTINITGNWTNSGDYITNTGGGLIMTGDTLDINIGNLILTGGTFPAGITTLSVDGDLDNTGDILPTGIDLTIDGINGDSTITCSNNEAFSAITINKTNLGEVTFASSCSTVGNFTRTNGIVTNSASAYTLTVEGDISISTTDAFGGSNLTVLLFNGNAQNIAQNTVNTFSSPLQINKSSNTATLTTDFITTTEDCDLTNGTFNLNGNAFTCGGTFTVGSGTTLQIEGGEFITSPTLNSTSTVVYKGNGNSSANKFNIKQWNHPNLTVDMTDAADDLVVEDILTDNLQGYWKMDEGVGNTVADSSTNSNAAILNNQASFTGTKPSLNFANPYAVDFDGSTDYLNMGDDLDIAQDKSQVSVSAYIKKDSNSGVDYIFGLSTGTSNSYSRVWLATSGDEIQCGGRAGDAESTQTINTSSVNLDTSSWYQVVCTINYATDKIKIYVNGTKVATTGTIDFTATSTSDTASQRSAIGEDEDKSGNSFAGQIDEVRFYDTLLTPAKVEILANGDNTSEVTATITVGGDLTITSGELVSPSTLNVAGNWSNSDTFTHNSATVVLNGTSQQITGSTTFNNFTKSVGSSDTLTFQASSRQTFEGTMTLKGVAGQILSLRSSSTPTQWEIDPRGNRDIEYLDVKDSKNVHTNPIAVANRNINNSGGNSKWDFNSGPSATTPSSISQSTDGSGYITFSTTVSDTDNDDTKLKVEYSDDGGSSWYDPDLISTTPSSGTVDLDDANAYQIGTTNAIDTSGGNITLTIVWDTQSAGNENGSLDDTSQDNIQVRVLANDGTDDSSVATSSSFTVDNLNPSGGSLSIDSAATYATSTSVTLGIGATSAANMMISENSDFSAASWESYATTKAFTLSSDDGTKTVYLKFNDNATNQSTSFFDSIILDSTSPTGSININGGATYTGSTAATLTVSGTDALSDVSQIMVSESDSFSAASWESYTTSKAFTLSSEDEQKTVYLKIKDNAGNESDSYSDTIILDSTSPTGSVNINNDATYTTSTSITLEIDATSASNMMISENSDFSGASWESYATSKAFTLSTGDGTKTIYLKFNDNAGNESDSYSDTIIMNVTIPGDFSLNSPATGSFTNNPRPVFKWKVSNPPDSDLAKYQLEVENGQGSFFSTDNIPTSRTTDWETEKYYLKYDGFSDDDNDNNYISLYTKSSAFWSSSQNDGKLKEGKRKWIVRAIDQAGNQTEKSADLYVDYTPPFLSVFTNQTEVVSSQILATTDNSPTLSGTTSDTKKGSFAEGIDKIRSDPQKITITITKIGNLLDIPVQTINIADLTESTDQCSDGKIPSSGDNSCSALYSYQLIGLQTGANYQIIVESQDHTGNTKTLTFTLKIVSSLSLPKLLEEQIEEQIREIEQQEEIDLTPEQEEEIKEEIIKEFPQPVSQKTKLNIQKRVKNALTFILNTLDKTRKALLSLISKPKISTPNLPDNKPPRLIAKIGKGITLSWQTFIAVVFDREPTKIAQVEVSEIKNNQATLTFITNHPSTVKVNYGLSTEYGLEKFSDQKDTNHIIILDGLESKTKYFFEIIAQGKNTAVDAYRTFETSGE